MKIRLNSPEGRFYLYGDDGSTVDSSRGFATLAEAEARLDDPALSGAEAVVVGRVIDDIYWH